MLDEEIRKAELRIQQKKEELRRQREDAEKRRNVQEEQMKLEVSRRQQARHTYLFDPEDERASSLFSSLAAYLFATENEIASSSFSSLARASEPFSHFPAQLSFPLAPSVSFLFISCSLCFSLDF